MKEVDMDIQWRTVQLFLEEEGVYEVEVDYDNCKKVRCNCKTFLSTAKCKHQKWVKTQITDNGGHFSIQIPVELDEDEALLAMSTPEGFREFVLTYGKVEVI